MQNEYKYVIGLMSGTSLDGLDLVYVKFNESNYKDFKIIYSETKSYSQNWKVRLQTAINKSKKELATLDIDYGRLLGEMTNEFIKENKIDSVDFIASHGHTVFHQPDKGITLQVGDGQTLANVTHLKVICDFRTQDVALKGQGAPLVPIGDELLFSEYDYCLNLGGFANVSFKGNDKRVAFDICPVNIVLNHYTKKIGLEYDENGIIASEGNLNEELLKQLNDLDFYHKNPPKSLGLEWVQKYVFPLINNLETQVSSILKTFVIHSAQQIGKVLNGSKSVLVTGGGTYNSYLIQQIEKYSETKIIQSDANIIEFKEALIFALLGLLKDRNEINCLSSVTGALKDHSSGKSFMPKE
ncbi:anhydro-N-acetylmuramic acid kinase [Tenacibaculum skagerrakense]|uniref:Anhydro-N-acetylmuramic acid kinase n=1 Tax=Tenacibaculum skagerrakense TaxID=186571 RepID=A0A4R2NNP2_9FLAO|nr:anhydro-N-acetylmuramic acid kinase [Tenacibaculum skagerrakense]TCP22895.1 anhydro-N-acetylmuramic acid kinase [Tenacibaculum skagerrakense]